MKLKLRKKRQAGVPVATTIPLAGHDFPIELNPLSEEEVAEAYKPFRKKKSVWNSATKQMESVSYLDTEDPEFSKVHNKLVCRTIHNFLAEDAETGAALDGTLEENKLALASVMVEDFEDVRAIDDEERVTIVKVPRKRTAGAVVIEKALDLSRATVEAEAGN